MRLLLLFFYRKICGIMKFRKQDNLSMSVTDIFMFLDSGTGKEFQLPM